MSGGGGSGGELPDALQGLCISEDGQHLIDSSTGKVVNEMGATRFDVAIAALRGDFDPPAYVHNTERSSSLLLDSPTQFPADYPFNIVVKQPAEGRPTPDTVLRRFAALIAEVTGADVPLAACSAKERLGGKWVSLCIPARVQAAHVVDLVWAELDKDPAVQMRY